MLFQKIEWIYNLVTSLVTKTKNVFLFFSTEALPTITRWGVLLPLLFALTNTSSLLNTPHELFSTVDLSVYGSLSEKGFSFPRSGLDMIFALLPLCALLCALVVPFSLNPVTALFALVVTFFFNAILLLSKGAEFLGYIILIVYVGAVAILFLFVIMLLNVRELTENHRSSSNHNVISALTLAFLTIIGSYFTNLLNIILGIDTQKRGVETNFSGMHQFYLDINLKFYDIQTFAHQLYAEDSALFIEITLILLVAMVGAIVLATTTTETNVADDVLSAPRTVEASVWGVLTEVALFVSSLLFLFLGVPRIPSNKRELFEFFAASPIIYGLLSLPYRLNSMTNRLSRLLGVELEPRFSDASILYIEQRRKDALSSWEWGHGRDIFNRLWVLIFGSLVYYDENFLFLVFWFSGAIITLKGYIREERQTQAYIRAEQGPETPKTEAARLSKEHEEQLDLYTDNVHGGVALFGFIFFLYVIGGVRALYSNLPLLDAILEGYNFLALFIDIFS